MSLNKIDKMVFFFIIYSNLLYNIFGSAGNSTKFFLSKVFDFKFEKKIACH